MVSFVNMVEEGKALTTCVKNRKQQQRYTGFYVFASAIYIRLKHVTWWIAVVLLFVLTSSYSSDGFCHCHSRCRRSSPMNIVFPYYDKKFLLSRGAKMGSTEELVYVDGDTRYDLKVS